MLGLGGSKLVFYPPVTHSKSCWVFVGVNWCFTPSHPQQVMLGLGGSKLVFYAQSPTASHAGVLVGVSFFFSFLFFLQFLQRLILLDGQVLVDSAC